MNEAELLFTEVLNYDRLTLYQKKRSCLDKGKSNLIAYVLKRRIQGEPLQYILGKTEFMGLEFKVDKDVFIPRPETEILVETAIRLVQSSEFSRHAVKFKAGSRQLSDSRAGKVQRILDLGTGSGCIAISLAKSLADVNITATDISHKAIEVAKYNAKLHNAIDKIKFIESDLFSNYELRTMSYELIVSNPPYIPGDEIARLEPEISYEPRIALDGGRDGIELLRKIIIQAHDYLQKGGLLILEIGFNQIEAIKKLFRESKDFKILEVIKDYNNIDRVVVVRKVSKNG